MGIVGFFHLLLQAYALANLFGLKVFPLLFFFFFIVVDFNNHSDPEMIPVC